MRGSHDGLHRYGCAAGVTDKGIPLVCDTTPNSPTRDRCHEP